MVRGSFATMQSQNVTEVTFHYVEGHTDSFQIPLPPQDFQQQLPNVFQKPWLVFHLVDQTIMICTARIVKVEIKPAMPQVQGEGIFHNCQQVTAMQRGAVGRIPTSG